MSGKEEISLYFHLPFCTKKCDYCHFFVLPDREPLKNQLHEALLLDWKHWSKEIDTKTIKTIYFGGGTPALYGPKRIEQILSMIDSTISLKEDVEITLEANPEEINYGLMQAYHGAGVNRVSIGIQSLDNQLLARIGRTHSAEKAIEAVLETSRAGFKNISVDLMFDLPGQTLTHWKNSLQQVVELPITHISLYNLTIEPNTVFFKYRDSVIAQMPGEEASKEMYLLATKMLPEAHFKQYELSAFCKEGFTSRHNIGYWIGRPFLGFGPSAFSHWNGKRFRNIANLNRYSEALKENRPTIDFEEELTKEAQIRELFIIHLRLLSGCSLDQFTLDSTTLKTLEKLTLEGFLFQENNMIRLTEKGMLFYDTVASELV